MLSLLAAVALNAAAHCGYQGEVQALGLARDPRNNNLAYCEYYLPTRDNRTRVLYYNPQGHRIAEKTLITPSGQKPRNAPRPEVVQQDYRHGEERIVRRRGDQWEMRYRESDTAGWEIDVIDAGELDVIDAGFDPFVRNNWDRLSAGDAVEFNFASPLHGRAVKLRARKVDCRGEEQGNLCLRVDLAQALLRMFAGDLYLVYGTEQRQLRQFEGIVNLLDDQGESQKLRIDYFYR
ncbi:hypothetical protein [Microbulbifer sp. YPW16]|uniref:hypothetical protein n=1 Tax=Microbulbifer sp. YPW16 TaxID=2904242 RepID=UPI001E2EC69A|nr:hypothetical protein [Microbulbifer sp. YPW16]UHQ55493.1 hypothetical protein LVE68_00450 [Microbulbifer sp. YPW16]